MKLFLLLLLLPVELRYHNGSETRDISCSCCYCGLRKGNLLNGPLYLVIKYVPEGCWEIASAANTLRAVGDILSNKAVP